MLFDTGVLIIRLSVYLILGACGVNGGGLNGFRCCMLLDGNLFAKVTSWPS